MGFRFFRLQSRSHSSSIFLPQLSSSRRQRGEALGPSRFAALAEHQDQPMATDVALNSKALTIRSFRRNRGTYESENSPSAE